MIFTNRRMSIMTHIPLYHHLPVKRRVIDHLEQQQIVQGSSGA
jgi:hypothetical protein